MRELCLATSMVIASFIAGKIEGWAPAITYGNAATTAALCSASTMWHSCLKQVLIKQRFNQRWQEQTRDHIEWCLIGHFEDWMTRAAKRKAAILVQLYSTSSAWKAMSKSTMLILRSFSSANIIDEMPRPRASSI